MMEIGATLLPLLWFDMVFWLFRPKYTNIFVFLRRISLIKTKIREIYITIIMAIEMKAITLRT